MAQNRHYYVDGHSVLVEYSDQPGTSFFIGIYGSRAEALAKAQRFNDHWSNLMSAAPHPMSTNVELEITDATQYADVYVDGVPVASVRRRHAFDPKGSPAWTITRCEDGARIAIYGIPPKSNARQWILHRMNKRGWLVPRK